MKRRIIMQGNKSFTFTLPIKWVRKHNLKGGEEISIVEDCGNLVLAADSVHSVKSISFSIRDMEEKNIRFVLNQLYRKGFSRITFKDVSKQQFIILESLIDAQLSGVEIVSKKEEECLIEVISEPKKDTFDAIFRKMFFTIQESLSTDDNERISKLTNKARIYEQFCKRYIANNLNSVEGYELYSALSYLLMIQADINRMKKRGSQDCRMLLGLFNGVSDGFYKKSLEGLYRTQKKSAELAEYFIARKADHYAAEIARIIYSLHSPIIGLIIPA